MRFSIWHGLAIAAVAFMALPIMGCTDPPPLPDVCEGEQSPRAPTVITAVAGRRDITADNLAIEISAPDDPDGDLLWDTEYEIWTVNADGSARERVWLASIVAPHPPPVTLSVGVYVGVAQVLGHLELWRDHQLRVRHISRSVQGCEQVGAWSTPIQFRTDDGSAPLFDDSRVRDIRVTLPPASYAAIDAEAEPPGCVPYQRSYYVGAVSYDGVAFDGIGAKVKGGCGSARRLNEKAALKLSFNWDDPAVPGCPMARRIGGLGSLTINNMVQDKSMAHERMAYELFRRMDVPAPRTAPVTLFVNELFFGHYLNVETVDRRFLARHFDSNQGMVYEGTYFCDLQAVNIRDDDTGCLTREFSPDTCDAPMMVGADPQDYTPIRQLVARLDALPVDGFYPAITNILDFDRYLSMWAVEAILSHWDGYTYDIVNNYRIYHDPSTDRWTFIPSGLDQTFGDLRPVDVWGPNSRIAQRCLREPACEAVFAARLHDAITLFESLQLDGERARIQQQLVPLVTAAPGREFDRDDFDRTHDETRAFIGRRANELRAVLAAHGY
jgi:CotH kinase protein